MSENYFMNTPWWNKEHDKITAVRNSSHTWNSSYFCIMSKNYFVSSHENSCKKSTSKEIVDIEVDDSRNWKDIFHHVWRGLKTWKGSFDNLQLSLVLSYLLEKYFWILRGGIFWQCFFLTYFWLAQSDETQLQITPKWLQYLKKALL